MLNSLLHKCARVQISYLIADKDSTQELRSILQEIADYLSEQEWKFNPETIGNISLAMAVFFEMFAQKIGGDMSSMYCYYFSTLVAKDMNLPQEQRAEGNKYRAFIIFKNIDKWNNIITMARLAPMAGYKGHLDENSFFDILLLDDVYKAWDADSDSALLTNLKKQAIIVANNHPQYTKQQVMAEGDLAHEAIFGIIKTLITN